MKIKFVNEMKKAYIELLPTIAFSWYARPYYLSIGWLTFFIFIDF